MAGTRGMKMPAKTTSVRQQLWRSIRIMRSFTLTGLMRTIPEGTPVSYANVQKFVRRLVQHGYVVKNGHYKGGNAGTAQEYRLVNDSGPVLPILGIGRAKGQLVNADAPAPGDTP